eukprot:scaffold181062_cov45-Prasinocladus_malaysianus.AAC.2
MQLKGPRYRQAFGQLLDDGYFVISLGSDAERGKCSSALRIYLSQPSPCWSHIDVHLGQVKAYNAAARMSDVLDSLHNVQQPAASQVSSRKSGSPTKSR